MELSKKDRVLLINQYRILAALDKDEASHYAELIGILEGGYEVFYSSIGEWVSDDMPADEGRFVLDILNLYRSIEDTKRVSKDRQLSEHPYAFFRGFDGNNETEYMAFCRFLVEQQGKFQEQQEYLRRNDNFNSHMPMIDKYRRMLTSAAGLKDKWHLSVAEALQVLEA